MTIEQLKNRFPHEVTLGDGHKISVQQMNADDRDAVLAFARGLPEEDLLFLRVDVTQQDVVDDWIANIASGNSVSLVAYDDGALVGYATVHRNQAPWTRRVGEIRVNVGPDFRCQANPVRRRLSAVSVLSPRRCWPTTSKTAKVPPETW